MTRPLLPVEGPGHRHAGADALARLTRQRQTELRPQATDWATHQAPESPQTPRPASSYVFGGRSLHRHGNQVLPSQQHQTQNPLLFTLGLLRVLWPENRG